MLNHAVGHLDLSVWPLSQPGFKHRNAGEIHVIMVPSIPATKMVGASPRILSVPSCLCGKKTVT